MALPGCDGEPGRASGQRRFQDLDRRSGAVSRKAALEVLDTGLKRDGDGV